MKRTLLCAMLAACGGGDDPVADAPANLCPVLGAQHEQTLALGDGVEDRTYFLYVPPTVRCTEPLGLLVDFHGTAGDPAPEEAYGTDELVALAGQYGFLVARPRSRSRVTSGGTRFYQWDINEGDIPRNERFAKKLVDDLAARFPIDRERVYASGYSSGSNMASRFLFDPAMPFKGIAPMAGGVWSASGLPPLGASSPRVYLATGYRDYLWTTTKNLVVALGAAGLPSERMFVRRSGGGHELHGWSFEEAWRFFDRGERPSSGGALDAPWTAETIAESADVNALGVDGSTLVAAAASGRLWRRESAGWTLEREQVGADYVTACFNGARGFVGGSYAGAVRASATWQDTTLPDYGMLGSGWINGADCRDDGSIVVVGYWSAAISNDGGATWSRFEIPAGFGLDAWGAAIATSPGGATVIAGYFYLGRAPAGTTTAIPTTLGDGWFNAVTALPGGRFWAVGDAGAIVTSSDDGRTWTSQQSGTTMDLYAVHFVDAQHGAAVGRAGTVLVTANGGATWTKRPLGRASYLGAVRLDATHVWIAGEDGLVASSPR